LVLACELLSFVKHFLFINEIGVSSLSQKKNSETLT
jgi:hypothetical protein